MTKAVSISVLMLVIVFSVLAWGTDQPETPEEELPYEVVVDEDPYGDDFGDGYEFSSQDCE